MSVRLRAQVAARAGARGAAQDDAGFDEGVLPQFDTDIDAGGAGGDDRDPGGGEPVEDTLLRDRADLGELAAVVHADREVGVGDLVGGHARAGAAQYGQDVREVALALGGVGPDLRQRVTERGAVEDDEPGVDLVDEQLFGGGVAGHLGLDDPLDVAVSAADDPAVPRRVGQAHRCDGRCGTGADMRGEQRIERSGGDERHVAREDDDGRVGGEVVRGSGDGAGGPVRLRLDRDDDVVLAGEMLCERAGRAVDDHDAAAGLPRGHDGPVDERAAAQVVQHLGRGRAHARALACGEHDEGGDGHAGIVVPCGTATAQPPASRS